MTLDPDQKKLIDHFAWELQKPNPNVIHLETLLSHCRECGEIFSYREGINLVDFGVACFSAEYICQLAEIAFCANCDTIQQTWRRQKESEPCEQCTIVWNKADDGRSMFCGDLTFDQGKPSQEDCDNMTAISNQNAKRHHLHRLRRTLSGPLYQKDAPLLIISFPKWKPKMGKPDAMTAFGEMLKRKREAPIEMQFRQGEREIIVTSFTRDDVVWKMRRDGDFPEGTTVWRWNDGTIYPLSEC